MTFFLSACVGSAGLNSNWPAVSAVDTTAYLAYGTQIHAINLENGEKRWSFPAEIENTVTFYSTPVLSEDNQLIAGSYDHKLYSINPETGAQIWVFTEAKDMYIGSPLVTSSAIYAPNADGKLYALDLNGQKQWEFTTGHALWATPATDPECSCIYQAAMDHRLYALDAADGSVLWKTEDLGGALVAQPIFGADGLIYFGTFNNEMLAVKAADGEIVWRYAVKGWIFSAPALHENVLYFGDLAGYLYAVDASNGKEIWSKEITGQISSTPLVKDGAIYISNRTGLIQSLTLEGGPRWQQEFDIKVEAPIISAGETILVSPSNSKEPLVAFNADGVRKWGFDPSAKK